MPALRNLWRRAHGRRPTLSVVVAVYNVGRYLPECLDSLLGQTLDDLEVIAVDDGSTDDSPEILGRRAAEDPRLRVLTQPNAGPGAARNRGLGEVRGEFVTFCDGDDRVPPRAYEHLVESLRRSGSDLVVGRARRFDSTGLLGPVRVRGAHAADRRGATLADFPEALHDLLLCNRVFRTEFWRARVGGFPEHVFYEDHLPMVTAYVRAGSFDVLRRTTYHWRVRDDNTSTTQRQGDVQNLRDRVAARESAAPLLLAEAPAVAYQTWLARGLATAWPEFLPGAVDGDDEYRSVLAATYRDYLERADDGALAQVPHQGKVLAHLCAGERWSALAEALAYFDGPGRQPRLVVDDGQVRAVPEPGHPFVDEVPAQLWVLAEQETSLLAGFRSAHWAGHGTLVLTGFVAIRGLDTREAAPRVEAWLRDAGGGDVVPVDVAVERDPEINQWERHAHACYDHGRFVVRVDAAALPARSALWALVLRMTHRGVTREGQVHDLITGAPFNGHVAAVVAGHLVESVRDEGQGLAVRVRDIPDGWQPPAEDFGTLLEAVAVEDGRLALTLGPAITAARLVGPDVEVSLVRHPDGTWRTPDGSPRAGIHDLEGAVADGWASARPGERLAPELPLSVLGVDARFTVKARAAGTVRVDVTGALDDQERTAQGQRQLRERHRDRVDADVPADDLVLLRAFGEPVEEQSWPAQVEAAVDRAPGSRVLWAVHGPVEPMPAGCASVLVGSAAWYDALGTAGTLVTSAEPPEWFAPRPGQAVIRVAG